MSSKDKPSFSTSDTDKPVFDSSKDAPSTSEDKPTFSSDKPVFDTSKDVPSIPEDKPTFSQDVSSDKPVFDSSKDAPSTSEDKPTFSSDKPVFDTSKDVPSIPEDKPTFSQDVSSDKPVFDSSKDAPSTSEDKPTFSSDKPVFDTSKNVSSTSEDKPTFSQDVSSDKPIFGTSKDVSSTSEDKPIFGTDKIEKPVLGVTKDEPSTSKVTKETVSNDKPILGEEKPSLVIAKVPKDTVSTSVAKTPESFVPAIANTNDIPSQNKLDEIKHDTFDIKENKPSKHDVPNAGIFTNVDLKPSDLTFDIKKDPNDAQLVPKDATLDNEGNVVKYKYPKAVGFIVCNEFCERFCFYGMRTILAIYLSTKLGYTQNTATVIYHVFLMCVYFFPILGAMIADSWLGRFRTIFYLSIVYALGSIVISIGAIEPWDLPSRTMTIIGLLLIALGTGGIKPCVSAFGGDQFIVPQQQKQLDQFFSVFYFAVNSGSLLSTFITPILRADVHCFGNEDCFPVAFGVPGILMIVSLIIFLGGKFLYKISNPTGNVLLKVIKCMTHAVGRKGKLKKAGEKREHWLDCADDAYDKTFIQDIKNLLRVMYLYLPLPIFWALYDQQGSRWTFQATRMNGNLGGGVSIKPDQMQLVNPLLILIFIPFIQTVVYPILAKCNLLVKPLHRLACGGTMVGLAFVISGVVELALEPTYAVLPSKGHGFVNVYNTFPCPVNVAFEDSEKIGDITALNSSQIIFELKDHKDITAKFTGDCLPSSLKPHTHKFTLNERGTVGLFLSKLVKIPLPSFNMSDFKDNIDKSDNGFPLVRVLVNEDGYDVALISGEEEILKTNTTNRYDQHKVDIGTYHIVLYKDESESEPIEIGNLELGGVYTVLINKENKEWKAKLLTNTNPNSVHMFWLIPQYVVLTAGEVMYSVTGLQFSYSQAPPSMKSVISACWYLTVAVGNLVVIIVAEAKIFESQAYEFFLFAGLMFVGMLAFTLMAWGYVYVTYDENQGEEKGNNKKTDELRLSQTKKEGIDNIVFKED